MWNAMIKVRRIFNKDENISNPCSVCGNELSIVEVDQNVFDRISEIDDSIIIDDEQRTLYICSHCVPMKEITALPE